MLWEGEVSRGEFWKWFYLPPGTTCTWAHSGKKGFISTCYGSNRMESAIWIVHVIHIGRYGPLGETPFHSRLSLCNKDLVEYAYFWIIWKVLKTCLEQKDSMWAMSLAVSWASVESPLCLQRSLNFQQYLSKCSNNGNPLFMEGFKKRSLKEFHAGV